MKQETILAWLEQAGVAYEYVEHAPAYTMQDMQDFGLTKRGTVCKNLFLRDHKGKRHFLVVAGGNKRVDLKTMGERLGQRLSFASAERLEKYLGVAQGEVSPLALRFDEGHEVRVLWDAALKGNPCVGVHPGVNTATVFLPFAQLETLVRELGNEMEWVALG